ncbi:MAG: glycoside hydrolase family 5 protein [Treponema sp.]|nr:glycoside hydrolase family 5 protein [Treponema sp.]
MLIVICSGTFAAGTNAGNAAVGDSSNSSAANSNSSMLHVEGNKIYNDKGEEVRLRGVNVCSLEWNSGGDNVLDSVYEVMVNWNCNIVRLPLSQDRWFGKVSDWSTPQPPDNGAQYRQIVDDVVALASGFGKYVEIDLHWSNAGEWGKNISQHNMPDEHSLEFWIDIAKRYANHPAVLFNLYNEPHDISWEVWRNGGNVNEVENRGKANEKRFTYTTPGHQKLTDEIRKTGARNIIIAGGIDWAYDLRGITRYALTDTQDGNGIVYDAHIYPWKEWDGKNHDTKVLCIADTHPIIIGEIGIDPDGEWGAAGRPTWLRDTLDWMEANKLHWTGWCFHPSATPSMISDWKYTPSAHHGAIMKERLLSLRTR